MSKTAVIILNWNGEQKGLIRRYLPSVVENTPSELAEVVVADNGSTDKSLQVLKEEFPSVRVIALAKNYGFADGYNRAIRQIAELKKEELRGPIGNIFEVQRMDAPDYIILLNDDVRVPEGWLEPMVKYMDSHPNCAGLQPKLLKDGNEKMFEYAGACGGYLDNLCYPYCRGRIFDTVEEDKGQYDLPDGQAWPVMWASGACLMVRSELYLRAGGLDPRFFAHMEEIDFCWRLRRLGYDLVCLPQSKVYHLGGASLPQGNPKKTKLNFRNSLLMMWKNLPQDEYKHLIKRRKILDGVAAANFLRQGQFRNFKAVYDAHKEAEKMIAEQYTAGELVGFGKAKAFMQEQFSILWKYYKKGIKKYSDLGL
jgi:hypothetical protein